MNHLKEVVIPILILALLPFAKSSVLPSDCSQFSDWKQIECQNILNDSSLSMGQRADLFLNLLESQGEFASYDFVWNWNQNLVFSSPPVDVVPKSSGIIKNAWLKIIGVNKSYFDLNKVEWFVEPAGQVLAAYNFGIELPSGIEPGDCQTNYSYQILNQDLSQTLNGTGIGSQKIVSYSTSVIDGEAMNFFVSLFLKTSLRVDHFRKNKYGFCIFYNTEYGEDTVNLIDEFNANAWIQDISIKFFLEKNPGLNKLIVSLDSSRSVNGFELNFGSNSFSFSETNFDLNFTPDGVLFVTKSYAQNKKTNGFVLLDSNFHKFVLGTTSIGNCSYKLFSDFGEQDADCGLVELKPVQLQIQSDANSFDFNQQIGVKVQLADSLGTTLSNKLVTLQAGERKLELITDSGGSAQALILAKDSKGTIVASFVGNEEFASTESVKRIGLFDSSALGTTEQALGFFGGYYFVFLIAKKFVLGV